MADVRHRARKLSGPLREQFSDRQQRFRVEIAGRHEPQDRVDREVQAALGEQRPVNMEAAFPEPPPPRPVRPDSTRVRARVQPVAPSAPTPASGTPPTPPSPAAPAVPVNAPLVAPPVSQSFPGRQTDRLEEMTAAQRLENVAVTAPSYVTEYKMRLLHRLLMRGIPMDLIARELGVTVRQVRKYRTELMRRLQHEAMGMNAYTLMGQTMAFYNLIREQALLEASSAKISSRSKMEALRVAMQAEADKARFLVVNGFFEAMKFQPGADKIIDGDDDTEEGVSSSLMGHLTFLARGEEAVDVTPAADPDDEGLFGDEDDGHTRMLG